MWRRCWGGRSEAVGVVTSGRVPQWRRASWGTEDADQPLDRCKASVCTPGLVSGCCCLPLLYWTLVSHFPAGRVCNSRCKEMNFFRPRMLSSLKVPYQINITKLIQPEVVDGCGNAWEVVGLEAGVTESNSSAEPGQNPPVWYTLLPGQLSGLKGKWDKMFRPNMTPVLWLWAN